MSATPHQDDPDPVRPGTGAPRSRVPRPEDPVLYRRLEVAAGASREEIVSAYRRLAHGVHPDAHPDDPDAARRFREITEAYDVLSDPGRRARYDRTARPVPPPVNTQPAPVYIGSMRPSPCPVPPSGAPAPLWAGPVQVRPPAGLPPRPSPEDLWRIEVRRLLWDALTSGWWS